MEIPSFYDPHIVEGSGQEMQQYSAGYRRTMLDRSQRLPPTSSRCAPSRNGRGNVPGSTLRFVVRAARVDKGGHFPCCGSVSCCCAKRTAVAGISLYSCPCLLTGTTLISPGSWSGTLLALLALA